MGAGQLVYCFLLLVALCDHAWPRFVTISAIGRFPPPRRAKPQPRAESGVTNNLPQPLPLARGLFIRIDRLRRCGGPCASVRTSLKGRRLLRLPHCENPIVDVVIFYPGESLTEQIQSWMESHPDYSVDLSSARSETGIRKALRGADVALLDATADPRQAMETFTQAVVKLGEHSVAVYTEVMHAWLELSVRTRGVLLLLGPMTGAQWEGFFERMLPSGRRLAAGRCVVQRPRKRALPGESGLREQPTGRHMPAGARRPTTGVR